MKSNINQVKPTEVAGRLFTLYLSRLSVIFSLLLVVAVSITWITSPDLGFHLKIGEHIWETKSIPKVDLFSFTVLGRPMLLHGWLSETLFYLIWKSCGYNGLILLKTLVILSSFVLMHFLMRKESNGLHEAVGITLTVLCSAWHFSERPAMFTLFFTCLFVSLLIKLETGWKKSLVLPILCAGQILWANLHGVFILGPIIIGLFTAGKTVSNLMSGGKFNAKELVWWGIFAAALLFFSAILNPFGIDLLLHPLRDVGTAAIKQSVTEMMSPFSKSVLEQRYLLVFYLCFVTYFLITLAGNWRRVTAAQWIVATAFFVLSTSAIRMIPVFAFAVLPILVWNGGGLSQRIEQFVETRFSRARRFAAQICYSATIAIIASLIFLVYSNRLYIWQGYPERFGLGLSKVKFPIGAAAFLKKNSISGPGFNLWGQGGYLMWALPHQPVFIDGRLDVYGEDFMNYYLRAVADTEHFANVLNERQIQYIVLPAGSPLVTRSVVWLQSNPSWTLVFFDEGALVYLRSDGVNRSRIKELAINVRDDNKAQYEPVYSNLPNLPFQVNDAPGIVNIAFTYEMFGNLDKALSYYEKALQLSECLPADVYYNMGRIQLKKGNVGIAELNILRALSTNPKFVIGYHALALIRKSQGNLIEARELWKKALEIDPQFMPAHKAIASLSGT